MIMFQSVSLSKFWDHLDDVALLDLGGDYFGFGIVCIPPRHMSVLQVLIMLARFDDED